MPFPDAGPRIRRPGEKYTKNFTCSIADVAVVVDPEIGLIAVGPHAPEGGTPCIRAWNCRRNVLLWESQHGQRWAAHADDDAITITRRNVYVARHNQLLCLDLLTGRRRWTAPLPAPAVSDRHELVVADPFPPGHRGPVLVPTIDNAVTSIDRDTGQPLWSRPYGSAGVTVTPVDGYCTCIVRYGFPYVKVEILNPAHADPVAVFGREHVYTNMGLSHCYGRTVTTAVQGVGHGAEAGIYCFDAATGAVRFFDPYPELDMTNVIPCSFGNRVYAALSDLTRIYVGIDSPHEIQKGNLSSVAMLPLGDTVVMLFHHPRSGDRTIAAYDARTRSKHFELEDIGSEPDDHWSDQLAGEGDKLVYVTSRTGDRRRCELHCVDLATGRLRWRVAIGDWRGHRFMEGQLVVWTTNYVAAVDPETGQRLGSVIQGRSDLPPAG